jgi:DNA-binding XRE family transcriptional regulator
MLYIIYINAIFVDNIKQIDMNRKKQLVFPRYQKILERVGENIRLARKRRKLTTLQVAERAGIDRTTLYHIEKGNSSVSVAAWFNTLRVLGLQDDFLKLAADDAYGRKLQDLDLIGNPDNRVSTQKE